MLRRTFLGFVLAALTFPARADTGLRAHFRARQQEGFLVVDLEIENRSEETQDILLWVGGRPATEVTANDRKPEPPEVDKDAFTNRAGPRHVWQPLHPGERTFAGSFRFAGAPAGRFTAQVRTAKGVCSLSSGT